MMKRRNNNGRKTRQNDRKKIMIDKRTMDRQENAHENDIF